MTTRTNVAARWQGLGALMVGLVLGAPLGCDDPPAPPMPAPAASVSTTASASVASKPKPPPLPPPPPRTLTPPSDAAIAKLDVKTACLAVCRAQVLCSVSDEVAEDEAKLAERQKTCDDSCRRTTPPKEVEAQYLDHARRCLHATDCAMFGGCAFGTQTVNQ